MPARTSFATQPHPRALLAFGTEPQLATLPRSMRPRSATRISIGYGGRRRREWPGADARQAARILDSALAHPETDDNPVALVEVLVYRAEVAMVLNGPANGGRDAGPC